MVRPGSPLSQRARVQASLGRSHEPHYWTRSAKPPAMVLSCEPRRITATQSSRCGTVCSALRMCGPRPRCGLVVLLWWCCEPAGCLSAGNTVHAVGRSAYDSCYWPARGRAQSSHHPRQHNRTGCCMSGVLTGAALTALIAQCAGPSPPIDLLTRIVMHESGGNPSADQPERQWHNRLRARPDQQQQPRLARRDARLDHGPVPEHRGRGTHPPRLLRLCHRLDRTRFRPASTRPIHQLCRKYG